jgi:hypothetical protein
MANTETSAESQVRVGVGVFVYNDEGSFIVGKRMGSHGAGRLFNRIHHRHLTVFSHIVQARGHCQVGTLNLASHSRLVQCVKFSRRPAS